MELDLITTMIKEYFDLSRRGMIERFNLLHGSIYRKLPKTFFLGDYIWEKAGMVETLKHAASV